MVTPRTPQSVPTGRPRGDVLRKWRTQARHLLEVFLAPKGPATRRAYLADLAAFRTFLNARSNASAVAGLMASGEGAAFATATLYRNALRKSLAAATVNRRLATLRSLTRTARAMQMIDWRLRIPPLRTSPLRDTAGPGREAVHRMMDIARARGGAKGRRDVAVFCLLYGMGLRRGEVVKMDRQDVRLERRPAAISIWSKGRNEYELRTMPERILEGVAGWAVTRGDHDGPLFTTLSRAHDNDRRITGEGLAKVVRTIGRAAGVETTPHGLRHTAITDAITRGNKLTAVQEFSRHADLKTVKLYDDNAAGAAADVAADIMADM